MSRKVIIRGEPFDRGAQYGQQVPDLIRKGVEFYVGMWEKSTGRSRGELLEIVNAFGEKIANYDANLWMEIEGIAFGADMSVAEILVVNGRYEIMLSTVFADGSHSVSECTSIGASSEVTDDGHTIVAQNWDWAVPVSEASILLEIQQEEGPDILTHVEAGFVGHKGINSEGIGLCANAMGSDLDCFDAAVPVWVLARSALNCSTIEDARKHVSRGERVASVNFTMAQDSRGSKKAMVASMEISPVDVVVVESANGRISHGNVFVEVGEERKIEDRLAIRYPGFCDRALRAESLTEINATNIDGLKTVLRDHENRPESICRHREDQTDDLVLETLASVVMDVTSGTMEVADGPPCQFEYVTHRLSR